MVVPVIFEDFKIDWLIKGCEIGMFKRLWDSVVEITSKVTRIPLEVTFLVIEQVELGSIKECSSGLFNECGFHRESFNVNYELICPTCGHDHTSEMDKDE